MQEIRFAIIGCGRIGNRHAEHILKMGKLVAVFDTDFHKSEEIELRYGAKKFDSLEELLNSDLRIDLISICSPNGLHAEQTIKALRAGFHVVCEKPMALNVYDCGEMIKAAEKANKRLFVVKQNRFNPPVEALKKLIDEGILGKITNVQLNCFWNRNSEYYTQSDWKGTKALDGGILYTQFSHFIDLLYWLIGDVQEVNAFNSNFSHTEIEFEDTVVAVLKFYNGTLGTANFTINSHDRNMEGSIVIFGEKGTVKIGGQYLNELEYQLIDNFKIENLPEGNPANNYGKYFGSMSNHDKVYENVIEVLTNNGIIATNGFEGLKTVEIIDKIYRACKA